MSAALLAFSAAILGPPAWSQEPGPTEESALKEDEAPDRIKVVRLGGSFPVDRGDGRIIPLWVLGHVDEDVGGSGISLSAWVKTTRLEAMAEAPLWRDLRIGLEARGQVLTQDDAPFRYDDGETIEARAFQASAASGGIFARYEGASGLTARILYRARRYFFDETGRTATTFRLPAENTTHGARLDVGVKRVRTYQMGEIREGVEAGVFGEVERRDAWRSWGDDPSTVTRYADARDYWRFGGTLSGYLRFLEHHNLQVMLAARFGEDLDFLSEYTLGSQFSYQRVVGYYYAEFRARRVLVANVRYGANLWEGARGTLILDLATYRTADDWDQITGVGAALRQEIWFGIPLMAQYGYGIDARRDGRHGGHEVYLAITAAF